MMPATKEDVDAVYPAIAATATAQAVNCCSTHRQRHALVMGDKSDYLSVEQAAERLNVSQPVVRWWCRNKGIGEKRFGRWYVRIDEVKRMMSEQKRMPIHRKRGPHKHHNPRPHRKVK